MAAAQRTLGGAAGAHRLAEPHDLPLRAEQREHVDRAAFTLRVQRRNAVKELWQEGRHSGGVVGLGENGEQLVVGQEVEAGEGGALALKVRLEARLRVGAMFWRILDGTVSLWFVFDGRVKRLLAWACQRLNAV